MKTHLAALSLLIFFSPIAYTHGSASTPEELLQHEIHACKAREASYTRIRNMTAIYNVGAPVAIGVTGVLSCIACDNSTAEFLGKSLLSVYVFSLPYTTTAFFWSLFAGMHAGNMATHMQRELNARKQQA